MEGLVWKKGVRVLSAALQIICLRVHWRLTTKAQYAHWELKFETDRTLKRQGTTLISVIINRSKDRSKVDEISVIVFESIELLILDVTSVDRLLSYKSRFTFWHQFLDNLSRMWISLRLNFGHYVLVVISHLQLVVNVFPTFFDVLLSLMLTVLKVIWHR